MTYYKPLPFSLFFILSLCVVSIGMMSALVMAEGKKDLPIFDAHIHYNHDVWDAISPDDAIRRLRAQGITRMMVSSSGDEGTQRLFKEDPSFVVPVLRTYRKKGTIETWMYDETVIPYLKSRLEKYRYAGIGELHIDGEQAYTPVMQAVIGMAKKYDLLLHVHSDAQAVEFIFKQYPEARILWAHAGFEYGVLVGKMMDKHKNLWADLSFRGEIINEGRLMKAWRILLERHPDRFLLGIDTYTPQRWLQLNYAMQWQRELLDTLTIETAKKIAYENGKTMLQFYDGKE